MQGKTADEHERSMAFAKVAFGQIRALGQVATPRNYEIWYTYATGYNAALNQIINDLLKHQGKVTEADLDQIYETHFSPTRQLQQLDQVGSQVKGEIEQVMAMIETAVGSANNYSE